MYGSIFRMRPKPGREADLMALFEEWGRIRAPKVPSARWEHVIRPDNRPSELIGVVAFADRESYVANANDPEQHRWYLRMRDLLEADPTWEDGEFIASFPSA